MSKIIEIGSFSRSYSKYKRMGRFLRQCRSDIDYFIRTVC